MKDISQIMRQAQAMQAKINEAQKKLEAMEVEGSSGGGLVKVRLSGKTALLEAILARGGALAETAPEPRRRSSRDGARRLNVPVARPTPSP